MADVKKILLTEDDEFLSSLIRNRLEREHFEVKVAKDGDEVLAMLKTYQPDLVLLDIILPKKLGFEVLEEIQANTKLNRAPVMVLSNLGQDSDIQRAKELGAVDYFIKAKVVIDDLIRRIKSFLEVKEESPAPAPVA
jgi:DNA-binding response OmpR family regulator